MIYLIDQPRMREIKAFQSFTWQLWCMMSVQSMRAWFALCLSLPWLTGDCCAGVCEQLLRESRLPSSGCGSPAERGAVLAGSSALPRTVSESFPNNFITFVVFQWPRPSLAFSLVKEEIRLLECWHVMHAECMPWPVPLCSVSFSFAKVLINTLPRFVAPGRTCSILILSRMLSCSYLVSGPVTEYLSHTQMNNTSPVLQNVQWVCFLCPIFMHTSKR